MVTFCAKMWPNEQNQIFRTGNGQILYGSTKFLQNEQVKGANLLKTSKNRHSVQERTQSCTNRAKSDVSYRKGRNSVRTKAQSCTEWWEGLAKQWGRNIVAPPLALRQSQRLQLEALHEAFMGSICASAVTKPHSFRKQPCSITHKHRVLSTIAEIAPIEHGCQSYHARQSCLRCVRLECSPRYMSAGRPAKMKSLLATSTVVRHSNQATCKQLWHKQRTK